MRLVHSAGAARGRLKHGCRTLLKSGNRDVLELFGFGDTGGWTADHFLLGGASVTIGEDLRFSFQLHAKQATRVRLEYGIDYVKANGTCSRKMFQISEPSLGANEHRPYTKVHSFADSSARKHYPGTHSLTLFVNGTPQGTLEFEVLAPPSDW